MPSKTISVTNGDGSTRTITIPDRSRFAGVRTLQRSLPPLPADPQNITDFTLSGPTDRSTSEGSYYKHSSGYWRSQNNSRMRIRLSNNSSPTWEIVDTDESETFWTSSEGTTYPWQVTTWTVANDGSGSPPTFGSFVGGSPFPTPQSEDIVINRTAPVITSDRVGESRPLLSKLVGGAAVAYSLRDLNDRNGNNKVVRVRRSSDNVERDFLAKEVFNGTLEAWVGAGNDGSVSIWYDQSGNGKDATQPTAGIQPKIVESGSLFADGLNFSPNRKINIPSDILASTDYDLLSVFAVAKANLTTGINIGLNLDTTNFLFVPLVLNSLFQIYKGSAVGTSPANTNTNLFSLTSQPDGILPIGFPAFLNSTFVNGSLEGTLRKGSQAGQFNGAGIGTYSSFEWNGFYQEIIIYNKNQTANRPAIEANIANQYGITLS